MKKTLILIAAVIFVLGLISLVGCQKKTETAPAVEQPATQAAPAATTTPEEVTQEEGQAETAEGTTAEEKTEAAAEEKTEAATGEKAPAPEKKEKAPAK